MTQKNIQDNTPTRRIPSQIQLGFGTHQKYKFQLGWNNACRWLQGRPLKNFGHGPKRDRAYVDGWQAAMMLHTAFKASNVSKTA